MSHLQCYFPRNTSETEGALKGTYQNLNSRGNLSLLIIDIFQLCLEILFVLEKSYNVFFLALKMLNFKKEIVDLYL